MCGLQSSRANAVLTGSAASLRQRAMDNEHLPIPLGYTRWRACVFCGGCGTTSSEARTWRSTQRRCCPSPWRCSVQPGLVEEIGSAQDIRIVGVTLSRTLRNSLEELQRRAGAGAKIKIAVIDAAIDVPAEASRRSTAASPNLFENRLRSTIDLLQELIATPGADPHGSRTGRRRFHPDTRPRRSVVPALPRGIRPPLGIRPPRGRLRRLSGSAPYMSVHDSRLALPKLPAWSVRS